MDFRRLAALLPALALLALAACGEDEVPLPGVRISVLPLVRALSPDPEIANLEIKLPRPQPNREWPQSSGYPNHAMHHLAAGGALALAWSIRVGEGSDDEVSLLTPPVVGGGLVFTTDALNRVSAIDARSGRRLWSVDLIPEYEEDSVFAGGLAYADGRLYVTTGLGEVFALDAARGQAIWRQSLATPIRAQPAVAGGRVFVITYDNRLFALSAEDGHELWSYTGLSETAGILGSGTPAVEGGSVIAPFSSGELVALSVEGGRVLWIDSLIFQARTGGLASLSDIQGDPVVDRGTVYAVSHSGGMVAIDLSTGARVWEQDLSGQHTPWIVGDFIYSMTNDGELVCVLRENGRIRWIRELPGYMDPEDREDPIYWSGPLLIGDRLLVAGTNGEVLALSPYTGKYLSVVRLPDPVRLPPIAADGTVYLLTEEARLFALR
ncbi:MAG: PQQ-binding-like beta-propeller repeat protein [Proteobacteria bacterium]|nr:PQQ-binding-like beta-propeller repeat protein [Pseudomonadota bacterium]